MISNTSTTNKQQTKSTFYINIYNTYRKFRFENPCSPLLVLRSVGRLELRHVLRGHRQRVCHGLTEAESRRREPE